MQAPVSVLRRGSLFALLVVVVALPVATAQGATPRTKAIRVPVRATGVGQDLGGGKTHATISSHGLVVGHTSAVFTIHQVVGTRAASTGPIVFTNTLGTLTAQVAGTFDVASGSFRATSTSLTDTGLLRGVSGSVTLQGLEDFATLRFTETITGRLCLDQRSLDGSVLKRGTAHEGTEGHNDHADEARGPVKLCGRWRGASYGVAVKAGNRENKGKKWCAHASACHRCPPSQPEKQSPPQPVTPMDDRRCAVAVSR
jgi:hypothetical protein